MNVNLCKRLIQIICVSALLENADSIDIRCSKLVQQLKQEVKWILTNVMTELKIHGRH